MQASRERTTSLGMGRRALGCCLAVAVAAACGETSRTPNPPRDGAGAAGEGVAGASAGTASNAGTASSVGGNPGAGEAGQHFGGAGEAGESPLPMGGGSGAPTEGGAAGEAAAGADVGGAPSEPPYGVPNRVFVTSEAYVLADLGGLSGADAKCAARAKSAGLGGTFVAWLSTSSVDAKTRLAGADAWYNVHSTPFADQAEELLEDSQVYYPILFDEAGLRVAGRVATGTAADGTALPQNCKDYSSKSAADAVVFGAPSGGSVVWTNDSAGGACDEAYHLYCFQVNFRAFMYPTPSQGRTVFVSAAPFVLGAQGRAAADAQCAADAQAAQLGGNFVALLPTSTESALARLANPSRPWVRPDGAVVASGTSALRLGPLESAVSQQADGRYVGGVALFGADDLDAKAALHCEDWKNPNAAVPAVIHGTAGHTDERWYAAVTSSCAESARVLCVEQ